MLQFLSQPFWDTLKVTMDICNIPNESSHETTRKNHETRLLKTKKHDFPHRSPPRHAPQAAGTAVITSCRGPASSSSTEAPPRSSLRREATTAPGRTWQIRSTLWLFNGKIIYKSWKIIYKSWKIIYKSWKIIYKSWKIIIYKS